MHFFLELLGFFGFCSMISKPKSHFCPVKMTLTFLKSDPSYTTLGFLGFSALE